MEGFDSDWRTRLHQLLLPEAAHDPATAFAMALLGGTSGKLRAAPTSTERQKKLSSFERCCAAFVGHLISPFKDGRRIPAIRNLATGCYLISVLHMVAALKASKNKIPPYVFVYGDLPPGRPNDPLVRAACQSFEEWISASWQAIAEAISERMEKVPTLPRATLAEKREQQLKQILNLQIPSRPQMVDDILEALKPAFKLKTTGPAWVRHVLQSRQVGFNKGELTRRVRSLGANIGLAGPDRGFGSPRLFFDTPLLGVLTKGIIGNSRSMDFRDFVTEIANQFGLVVGTGNDPGLSDHLDLVGSGGLDPEDILARNQEQLRKRLVRVGLARTYSDSHTEVLADV
jgi:hypothetical protein